MRTVTVINAKGGCGKSTIAMNLAAALAGRGYRTLLIDLDPQAQITAWLNAGDGLTSAGTIVMPMAGKAAIGELIQGTRIANLFFIPSAQPLEDLGRQITEEEGYYLRLTEALSELVDRSSFALSTARIRFHRSWRTPLPQRICLSSPSKAPRR